MSDQERYIQVLEREIAYLRIKLYSVRRLLNEAYGLADPSFAVSDPDMQAVLQDRIEEVLSNGE